ncbi:MAG: hypothetical protein HYX82_00860 [Chloroflexi bacterium]|nr:hypothetical protein [Chloroflexota bacterium]
MVTGSALKAKRIVEELKKCGITHVVWLPDTEARFMYDTLINEKDIKLVQVCREGETVAIAAGLYVGGKEPCVLIQNTGFLESGDSIRGLAIDIHLPLLIIIGYRGWKRVGNITDSAAIYIEPILDAWGIKHYLVETDADAHNISIAHKEAHETKRPVAVLIGREYQ